MDFGLTLIANVQQDKVDMVYTLSDKMSTFFKEKNYGDDIKSYSIGVICVPPENEHLFKKNIVPKYTRDNIENSLEYGISLKLDSFIQANGKESVKILAEDIYASLALLNTLKKKIKDFDFDKFKLDMEKFFHSEGLMSFG